MGARSSQSRGPGLNETDGHLLEYFRNTFGAAGGGTNAPPGAAQTGLTATGGIVSDYTSGTDVYRAHVFASSGDLDVTALGVTANRLARVDLNANETFFFEANYPIVLTDRETVVVEVTQPSASVGGAGIGSAINYQILGDTDI